MKRALVVFAAALLAALLIAAMLELPAPAVDLPAAVGARLGASGVAHPVTAVLLNFRGYDTLLEIAVLLLALVGVLAAGGRESAAGKARAAPAALRMLARLAAPLMTVVAVYLLWAGALRPGGAFQAGAVLAAAAVLLHLVGLLPAWRSPVALLRLALASGFLVFLVVAAVLLASGALLQYPPARAGALILLIEAALAVSLGLLLAGLLLFVSRGGAGRR